MIKAIIFDLDNTLIDFWKFKRVSCEAAVDAMIDAGLKMKREDALDKLYELYLEAGLENPQIFQKFLSEVNGGLDYRMLAYAIVAYRQARTGFLRPYPHVKKMLISMKDRGLKLAIVSDAPRLKVWIRLTVMKLDDFFDVIMGLEDTGKLKPNPAPFLKALDLLGVEAGECLMVGDQPLRDIKGAQEVGMKTAFAKYGFERQVPEDIKADHDLESIEDLISIIEDNS